MKWEVVLGACLVCYLPHVGSGSSKCNQGMSLSMYPYTVSSGDRMVSYSDDLTLMVWNTSIIAEERSCNDCISELFLGSNISDYLFGDRASSN